MKLTGVILSVLAATVAWFVWPLNATPAALGAVSSAPSTHSADRPAAHHAKAARQMHSLS